MDTLCGKNNFNRIPTMPLKILAKLKAQNNYRSLKSLKHEGKFVFIKEKKLLNLAGNDYLNLAKNQGLKEEFFKSLQKEDCVFSSSSSRSLSGNFSVYEKFETNLALKINGLSQIQAHSSAKPHSTQSLQDPQISSKQNSQSLKEVLHFNSGYHLNFSCIKALGTLPNTLFIADKFIHASIIDGLIGAKFLRFKHNDMAHLQALLEKHHKAYENIIIISEALFSMDGDFAPLKELVAFKKAYKNVLLYIDEAHSVGCFDESGLGIVKQQGLIEKVDFLVFTFGKAIASMGACMITSKEFKAFFINKARAFIYSTALPPINVTWSNFVFQNLEGFEKQRAYLRDLSSFFRNNLSQIGYEILGEAYILSLLCGSNEKANKQASKLLELGFFAPSIKEPTVPKNTARIRFSLHAGLSYEDLERLIKHL